jgi:D-alanyl-D-alanine dipeptidase
VKVSSSVQHWLRFVAIALLTLSVACQGYTKSTANPTTQRLPVPQPIESIAAAQPNQITPGYQAANAQLVDIRSINAAIHLDLRYATANNFMHRVLYKESRCLLRAVAAKQLSQVQADLEAIGLGLKVYDCYRPLSVQKQMWKLVPDDRYVANPTYGSRHNRGSAVDLTLVDRAGRELKMPTDFDDFTERAATTYDGASVQAKQNRQRLQEAMVKHGFIPLQTEWWHFDAASWAQFPVLDVPLEAIL